MAARHMIFPLPEVFQPNRPTASPPGTERWAFSCYDMVHHHFRPSFSRGANCNSRPAVATAKLRSRCKLKPEFSNF
jgi:hypothetical protein